MELAGILFLGGLHGLYLGLERYLISKFKNKSYLSDVRPFVKKVSKFFILYLSSV